MGIDEINAMGAGIACGGLEIESVVRKGSVVLCDSVTFPIEKVFVEFEDEDLAVSFEECVKDGTARIVLDEDTSINAAPKELQEEYELALVSGDEERLEGVLTELWEEYGIEENAPMRGCKPKPPKIPSSWFSGLCYLMEPPLVDVGIQRNVT